MTWEIIAALITCVLFLVSVGTVLAKLIRTLTSLDVTLTLLSKRIDEDADSNAKSHKRMFDELDSANGRIGDHETRIKILEHDDKGGG